jgi:hypothetical protein
VSSFCNVHSLGLLLCIGHELLQADASWMFGVETEQATYDNVLDEILEFAFYDYDDKDDDCV